MLTATRIWAGATPACSDFYALPEDDMQAILRELSAQTGRLWHYRRDDTVNDLIA